MGRYIKSIINICVLVWVILSIFPIQALAAEDGFSMPTFTKAWKALDAGIKTKLTWIVGIALVVLIICAILGAMFGGAKATLSTITGNVGGRSEGISSVLITIGVVFLATIVIGFVLWIAG